ncbi:YfgM family protein [Simplicispira psychrophila]|uniref:YfgM family protein n=1 Tax=Simplicispira psychrophila TaxID=80882 RepID=UPI0004806376|nr:tetratricopeptide repeat protein [Simplicispira psychrophila]
MANHLDLEEQEQLDQLKHFWNTWGALISSILVVIFGLFAIWNGYQFWQNREALQAAALLDAVENAGKIGDENRLEQAFIDIRRKYGSTNQAGQAGLIVAKVEIEKGNMDAAQSALEWVAGYASDDGYKALAQLRLASLLMEKESYDGALQHLSGKFSPEFDSIIADRKGDILVLQNKKQQAIVEYNHSYSAINDEADYRRLLEVKLNALGVQPQVLAGLTTGGMAK